MAAVTRVRASLPALDCARARYHLLLIVLPGGTLHHEGLPRVNFHLGYLEANQISAEETPKGRRVIGCLTGLSSESWRCQEQLAPSTETVSQGLVSCTDHSSR